MANVAKDFAQLISQSKSNKTGPYDTQATVKRVEGNTVWVSIPGGVDETPIDKTVNCTAGDKVQVRVSGGRAWITGNASAPPTDDTTAIKARTTANEAQVLAVDAKETADAVEGIAVNASATAVTAKTIAEGVNEHFWHDNTGAHVTEVTQEEWNEPTDPNYHSGGNTLITTQGMAIRNGLTNLAEFGATGATIGVSGAQIAHLGYGPGIDSGGGTSDAPYYTLGVRTGSVGNYSTTVGYNTEAGGFASFAEGEDTIANQTDAHAEGGGSVALGVCSHAQNWRTRAYGNHQTALGRYNIENYLKYAVIVGNGTADNARSNALTVDWSGNVEAAGDIEDGSGNVLSNKLEASSLVVDTDVSIADNISVSSGQTSDGNTSIAKTGYTPLGVVGYRVVNASSSGLNGAFGVISHAYITGNTAYYRVRNTGSANMKVRIYFNILYVKS